MVYKVDGINLPIKKRNKLLDLVFVDHNSKGLNEEEIKNSPSLLLDAYDLSAVFKMSPSQVLHCLTHRDTYQSKITLENDRVVYKSKGTLYKMQAYISKLLQNAYSYIDIDHLLAYIKGVNYIGRIKGIQSNYDILISMDIKKYFDTITKQHIFTLFHSALGYNKALSNMYTKLVTVSGVHPLGKYKGDFLQQGSPASPILSNLIGYFFYDIDIKKVLDEFKHTILQKKDTKAEIDIDFFRYCDNIYIGLRNTNDIDNIKELVKRIKFIMQNAGFVIHKDKIITRTNRRFAQQILGIVINNTPKICDTEFSNKKAQLVNIIAGGLTNIQNNLINFYNKSASNLVVENNPLGNIGKVIVAKQILHGIVNYYYNINEDQGKQIHILNNIINVLYDKYINNIEVTNNVMVDEPTYIKDTDDNITTEVYTYFRNFSPDYIISKVVQNSNIIEANKLSADKMGYITGKLKDMFNIDTMLVTLRDTLMINAYIPVTASNVKDINNALHKLVNNHKTSGVLIHKLLPYLPTTELDALIARDTITNPSEITEMQQMLSAIRRMCDLDVQKETLDKTSLYVGRTTEGITTSTIVLRLPIFDIPLSKMLNSLYDDKYDPSIYDNLIEGILSSNSVLINIGFVGLDGTKVKQSRYQVEAHYRRVKNIDSIDKGTPVFPGIKEQDNFDTERATSIRVALKSVLN